MEFSFPSLLIIPFALGLLGFVEPCTVGGHLIFIRAIADRPLLPRAFSTLIFASVRTLIMGLFGATIALIGPRLIDFQTGLWVAFGSIYLLIGLAYAFGRTGMLKHGFSIAPAGWSGAANPVVLGVAFGLNIPACAAPILFGLIGMAANSGAVSLGFATMAVFGLALSVPLVLLVSLPIASAVATRLTTGFTNTRWVFSVVFIILGLWSIWFGFFVNPEDWSSV